MKGQIFLFSICFAILQNSYSQTNNDKNVISLSIGLSLPVGSFASTDPSDKLAGYAKVGETINISILHKLNKNIGIVATLYGERNGLNTNLLAKQFAETAIPFYYNGGGPNYYPNWVIDKKSWYLESFLLGLNDEFFIKPSSKLSFTAKALIGIADVQLPKLNASSKTDTSFATITQNGASALGLSYLASVGVKYKWSKILYLIFGINYFGTAQISFKNVTETITATNGGLNVPGVYSFSNSKLPIEELISTNTNKQPIGSVNVNFGIEISL